MSDEWIEGRSLRRAAALADEKAQPAPEPAGEPPDFVPRFLTTTGELKPLSERAIAELEALIAAHARGETSPGYVPQIETETGEMQVITAETLEELARYVRRRGSKPPPSEPPPEYVPWFDTVTGELPAILTGSEDEPAERSAIDDSVVPRADRREAARYMPGSEDVIDAEWVVEVGERLRKSPPRRRRARPRRAPARRAPSPRRVWWPLPLAVALVGVLALALLVPGGPLDRLRSSLPGGAEGPVLPAAPIRTGSPTPAPAAADLPAPTTSPPPEPYRQGRLAFASNRGGSFDIYLLDMLTGVESVLVRSPGDDRSPAWSPDGTRLVFVSNRAGSDNLYVVGTDGSDPIALTTGQASDRSPAWSPDGRRIVFARETVDGSALLSFDVSCINEPGACENALSTLTGERYDRDPAWSPDGRRIAFAAADFPGLPSAIGLLTLDSAAFEALSGTGSVDGSPAWSPDGSWLVFVSNRYGDDDLWMMRSDGSSLVQVTKDPANDIQPVWSADGGWLVFASDRGGDGPFSLFVMRAACALAGEAGDEGATACEAEAARLTDPAADDLDPAWAP